MHNISSPRTDDYGVESEIVAKGLTAPRVTLADISRSIISEHYFTAGQGAGANDALTEDPYRYKSRLDLLTFCVLILRNGFMVTGESACVSPESFDAEIGKKVARENAVQKIWPLMGFLLKEDLYQKGMP